MERIREWYFREDRAQHVRTTWSGYRSNRERRQGNGEHDGEIIYLFIPRNFRCFSSKIYFDRHRTDFYLKIISKEAIIYIIFNLIDLSIIKSRVGILMSWINACWEVLAHFNLALIEFPVLSRQGFSLFAVHNLRMWLRLPCDVFLELLSP